MFEYVNMNQINIVSRRETKQYYTKTTKKITKLRKNVKIIYLAKKRKNNNLNRQF